MAERNLSDGVIAEINERKPAWDGVERRKGNTTLPADKERRKRYIKPVKINWSNR